MAQSKIVIETGSRQVAGRRIYRRKIRNPRATGHVATTWGGTKMYQWTGEIVFYGKLVQVWGYSYLPCDVQDRTTYPTKWSDDTY